MTVTSITSSTPGPGTASSRTGSWSRPPAASCVEANLVTTAAIVWGEQASDKLAGFEQAVRLVRSDGEVFSVNGWPLEEAA